MGNSKKSTRDKIMIGLFDAVLSLINNCTETTITQRERDIVSMYMEGKSFEEIGKIQNISSERVRRIIYRVLEKMESSENVVDRYLDAKARCEALKKEVAMLRHAKSKVYGNEGKDADGVLLMDCNLSQRILKPLSTAYPEVRTIYELSQKTKKELLSVSRLGRTSVKEIEDLLANFGYSLKR